MQKLSLQTCLLAAAALAAVALNAVSAPAADDVWATPPAEARGKIVLQVVMVEDEDEDPKAAGKAAAEALKKAMGDTAPKVVLVAECFEDLEYKRPLLEGITSVLPNDVVLGGATYGAFTREGCTDFDSVCLLGIGGDGVSAAAALVTELGTSKLVFEDHEAEIKTKLHAAGKKLAGKLRTTDQDKLLVLVADAHSPKNRYLVEGAQEVVGKDFAVTGGSANKNAGQTYVYFRGKPYQDAAVAVMLSGDFSVSLAGRKAQDNDAVIRTAGEGAAEAMKGMSEKPIAVLSFNCAGRRGKLDNYDDELAAIRKEIGKELPLWGCYCAGEIGPLDATEREPGVRCGGSGWHVMFTVIGR
jgi:hypothetical protein